MSFFIEYNRPLHKRKIHNWSIQIANNLICGEVQLVPNNIYLAVCGEIIGFRDNIVVAKFQQKIYALIFGNINPKFAIYKDFYFAYLRTKRIHPSFVV